MDVPVQDENRLLKTKTFVRAGARQHAVNRRISASMLVVGATQWSPESMTLRSSTRREAAVQPRLGESARDSAALMSPIGACSPEEKRELKSGDGKHEFVSSILQ